MQAKSEKKIQDAIQNQIQDAIQNQMGKCRKLLEESIFLGNSFFLTGQNLPVTNCKNKMEMEDVRNSLGVRIA
ncbi:hypothetical protein [Legionella longbeachae]|uniref:Uncharacterized protein n=1 Tax=Legionella longbeachae serogroup 1 (strain NSW150) TaxID=661367 RepID=D3HTQ6_LEGLN|nr:hypothetical protein [Legionella longbeachae]VEE02813.1 Uncharacterised protein [Legionella oakridgensis]HBD7397991.1 hypothetical protein [Legionella pneumophila]ARB90940.1 hypothetical protein A6J40_01445 [Legionella longbeachae]ARM32630.1 hypothetical protein B0B39_03465 [Legionella longbeachae]QEY51818.1 hypothetical protein FQU71_11550 [Legionella longbeachae]